MSETRSQHFAFNVERGHKSWRLNAAKLQPLEEAASLFSRSVDLPRGTAWLPSIPLGCPRAPTPVLITGVLVYRTTKLSRWRTLPPNKSVISPVAPPGHACGLGHPPSSLCRCRGMAWGPGLESEIAQRWFLLWHPSQYSRGAGPSSPRLRPRPMTLGVKPLGPCLLGLPGRRGHPAARLLDHHSLGACPSQGCHGGGGSRGDQGCPVHPLRPSSIGLFYRPQRLFAE